MLLINSNFESGLFNLPSAYIEQKFAIWIKLVPSYHFSCTDYSDIYHLEKTLREHTNPD